MPWKGWWRQEGYPPNRGPQSRWAAGVPMNGLPGRVGIYESCCLARLKEIVAAERRPRQIRDQPVLDGMKPLSSAAR